MKLSRTYHLLGLPHSKILPEYSTDAFTIKVGNMAKMLSRADVRVITYGVEGSQVEGEFVPVLSADEFARIYPGDHRKNFYDHSNAEGWGLFRERVIAAIKTSGAAEPGRDICLVSYGRAHRPIVEATGLVGVELGIGYPNSCPEMHRVFESYAWMHYTYGTEGRLHPPAYDAVIPNYYDLAEFPRVQRAKSDYFAYVGRLTSDKGWNIAIDVASRLGVPIKIAGQGELPDVYKHAIGVEHVGTVTPKERAKLIGGAAALFVPSQYVEPFGSVAVEGVLMGTPVISSDWGAFPETVKQKEPQLTRDPVMGYRCRLFDDYLRAAKTCLHHETAALRRKRRLEARSLYSLDAAAVRYLSHFAAIERLHRPDSPGWYEPRGAGEAPRYGLF